MEQNNAALIDWARSIWPQSFTQREAADALGARVRGLGKIRGLMDTGARRYDWRHRPIVLWRYRPLQLRLPLGDE